jgi:hypothetical protein
MPRLIFKAKDVRRVVEHTMRCKQSQIPKWETATEKNGWTPKRVTPKEPIIMFVHDQGVYLMSNGTPRDIIGPDGADMIDRKKGDGRSFVAYAEGCNPDRNRNDWWDTSRCLVGGDDFVEYLPWTADMLARLDAGEKEIVIEVGPNSLALVSP